jgi:hypothetical protein
LRAGEGGRRNGRDQRRRRNANKSMTRSSRPKFQPKFIGHVSSFLRWRSALIVSFALVQGSALRQ